MKVLGARQTHFAFADIVFWPLVWSLVPRDSDDVQLGPQVTRDLTDASDWILYGPDRTFVDLRSLTRRLNILRHPLFANRDEWIEMMTSDKSAESAVVLYGRRPS